ncbi:MarR family winged helix-turn-helix transcriptional regulator [Streptomyces yaanensis]|uniref:MarR family winged helix-turn-helix transcriptional regulator n=1 Tax=Streptomyces yaanensis TaxID=1142239 RepID=A0ABV7SK59_9ACTN|nr:MarR family transcriptional regulator [Streptomyces sp. CGMCC 4.7035]WNC01532.1 MarR family transcriptional regulator [Streptomyces sp. CGMCC 4.7035]
MTAEPPRWLTGVEEQAWRGLLSVFERLITRTGQPLQTEYGLSAADYMMLAELTRVPGGRLRVLELAKELGWEKSRVSHHMARMARRGLVDRETCAYDRRGVYVSVTPAGYEVMSAATRRHANDVRRLFFDHLTSAQVTQLAEITDTVLDVLAGLPVRD